MWVTAQLLLFLHRKYPESSLQFSDTHQNQTPPKRERWKYHPEGNPQNPFILWHKRTAACSIPLRRLQEQMLYGNYIPGCAPSRPPPRESGTWIADRNFPKGSIQNKEVHYFAPLSGVLKAAPPFTANAAGWAKLQLKAS